MQYRDDGYLPEALLNYLVRLGWSHGDSGIFTCEEMIEFSAGAVNNSASAFNTDKPPWLNHHDINTLPAEQTWNASAVAYRAGKYDTRTAAAG